MSVGQQVPVLLRALKVCGEEGKEEEMANQKEPFSDASAEEDNKLDSMDFLSIDD